MSKKSTKFEKLDFKKIREHLDFLRDQKKEMTKEEKNILKEERALVARENGYALIDGRIEKVCYYYLKLAVSKCLWRSSSWRVSWKLKIVNFEGW